MRASRTERRGHATTRGIAGWLLCGCSFLALACRPQPLPADSGLAYSDRLDRRPPDIVLVSIDSLRPDHLGCYGYPKPTSPTIDRLAREGTRFETAVSTSSWTLPAHAAMFTGLFDEAHGMVDNGLRLSEDSTTLAELLRAAGYHTAGFFGGPYLHPTFGLSQGFDLYQSCMAEIGDQASDDHVREVTASPASRSHQDVTGPRTLAEVRRWSARLGSRPFFLFLHLWDVHHDYLPPPEYARRFDPDYQGTLDPRGLSHNDDIHAGMPARDLEHLVALYDAEIAWTDYVLGEILAELERQGRLENTLIIVTADHGEEFFEHGGKGHQRTLYDEVLRVPLVFHWPGHVPAGAVSGDQASLVDLLPTIGTIAGFATPLVQGRDLVPLLRGESLPAAPALCELSVPPYDLQALRTEGFKWILSRSPPGTLGFDLGADPHEQHPLAASDPRVAEGLAQLEALRAETRRDARNLHTAPEHAPLAPELELRLEELGYTGAER